MTVPGLLQSSNPNLIEARRRNTLSKMKGLVIPENGTTTSDGVAESGAKNSASAVTLSAPPWKAANGGGSGGLNCSAATLPKYSPAFKRKPFTIYTSENIVSKSSPSPPQQTQAAQTVKETAATKGT